MLATLLALCKLMMLQGPKESVVWTDENCIPHARCYDCFPSPLSARFSHSRASVSPYTTPTSTPIYFIGNSKKVLLEEKTMCITPHDLLFASSSYIRTIWITVGALDLLVWLSSGCDGCPSTTWHPPKPPTVVLCRNPRSSWTHKAMSIPKVCRKLENVKILLGTDKVFEIYFFSDLDL